MAFLWDLKILNELQHSLRLEGLEEIRLIKDKRTGMDYIVSQFSGFSDLKCFTGQSRGFAFAQFVSISDARRFLDRNYPSMLLHGTYDPNNAAPAEPAKVRIAYSRERDDKDRAGKNDDDWKCDVVCSIISLAQAGLM